MQELPAPPRCAWHRSLGTPYFHPRMIRAYKFAKMAFLFACLPMLTPAARAQWIGKQTGCYADEMQNNPNRPTVANPADITQYGVLEIEYGWDHGWPARNQSFDDAAGLLKFGLLCDVELRWTTTEFLSQTILATTERGIGDNWLGTQIRFYHQTARVPSMALSYAVKIPSASSAKGLGSGEIDHQLTFLASKDVRGRHFDFNLSQFWIGRASGGFDTNQQLNFTFSQNLYRGLQFQGEFYGDTQLNSANRAFASALGALVWMATRRLEVDAGVDTGMTHNAPRRRVFVGFTYSIANLYQAARHSKGVSPPCRN